MNRKDHVFFVNHPDTIALISSTDDVTYKSPANTMLEDKFKVACSLADSFKKSMERDASLFTTFKEGKYWDAWHRNTLATDRV